jgi:predicted nucleotidyltransferase
MTDLAVLPPDLKQKLDGLRDALVDGLGDELVALVVYGSAVRGGWVAGRSDVDVIAVLRRDDRACLDRIANAIAIARTSARIETMLLTAAELPRAADVFPLLYDDVRSKHVLLHGDDPFAELAIADTHRRLRIEQELREARIRLRLLPSEAPRLPRGLRGAVARKLKQMRGPLHALLALDGRPPADDRMETVLEAACAAFGVDAATLLRLDEEPEAAYDALARLLDAAIDHVDELEV